MSDKHLSRGISFLFSRLPPAETWLHAIVMSAVLLQLLSSFFMHVHVDTPLTKLTPVDWYHVFAGLGLLVLAPVFMALLLKRRHLRDLYPWLFGQFQQLKTDLRILKGLSLPDAQPGGLAACLEGLGLLALLLAVFSGAFWLAGITLGWQTAPDLLGLHKALVGLIEAYVWGHGGFALLHLLVWRRHH
ncbi:cytochrome b/b6 domain-containing protein [Shewanella corallii]|uniref:Cytochrome b/b6 domain-containing protein n=1 Tax=Shewanella corallii TaxID=560080 RepID=A0ABT0N595_9GAMM|nr:cytochrome b/b6 domain-containing protein [Shewanella corallii]MCL2913623.1 cytochrome b/b6 domain-containing protein [Shewanella corallii]